MRLSTFSFTNRTQSWNYQDCTRATLLWVCLQHWLSALKEIPWRRYFLRSRVLRNGFHLTVFSPLNKGLISGTIMRLWHGGLFHLLLQTLLQLAADKESKSSLFSLRVGAFFPLVLPQVRRQHLGAMMVTAREARIRWCNDWYTDDSATGLDPRDTVGDAPWLILTWQPEIFKSSSASLMQAAW